MSTPDSPVCVTAIGHKIGNILEVQYDDTEVVTSFVILRKTVDSNYIVYDEVLKSSVDNTQLAGSTYQAKIQIKHPEYGLVNYFKVACKNSDGTSSYSTAATVMGTYACLDTTPLRVSRSRTLSANVNVVQYDYGNEARQAWNRRVKYSWDYIYDSDEVTDDYLRDFYRDMYGQYGSFFLPSWISETKLTAQAAAGATAFSVDGVTAFSKNINELGNNIYVEDGEKSEVQRIDTIDFDNSRIYVQSGDRYFSHASGTTIHIAVLVRFDSELSEELIVDYVAQRSLGFSQVFETS